MHSALQKEIDQTLAVLATPVEAGQSVRAAVGVIDVEAGIRYQAYWGKAGMTQRDYFGPVFDYPRDALKFVDEVNTRGGLVVGARS